jgi:hypothetical protein
VCHALAAVGSLLFSKHTRGGSTTPAFSRQLVYLPVTWGSAPCPLSNGAFPLTATLASFFHSEVARQWPPLPPFSGSGCPASLSVFFFSASCLLFSFFFLFSLGRDQSVQGAMLIFPREYHVALICHLVVSQAE